MDLPSLPNSVNILVGSNEFVVEIVGKKRKKRGDVENDLLLSSCSTLFIFICIF